MRPKWQTGRVANDSSLRRGVWCRGGHRVSRTVPSVSKERQREQRRNQHGQHSHGDRRVVATGRVDVRRYGVHGRGSSSQRHVRRATRPGVNAAYRKACDPPPTTSIPPAIWPTSALATRANALRSIISTVPGSEPTPSTEMKAYRSSPEMATPCTTRR